MELSLNECINKLTQEYLIISTIDGEVCDKGQDSILSFLKELQLLKNKEYYRRKNYPKLFLVWQSMKNRCYNDKTESYKNYGARGITVCDEWRNSSTAFIQWAVLNGYKEGLQLDRIDNDGNYEPSNCQWSTPQYNSSHKRNSILLTVSGETKTVSEWSRVLEQEVNLRTIYRWVGRHGVKYAEEKIKFCLDKVRN